MMLTRNLNYYYYVEYFKDLSIHKPADCEEELLVHNKELSTYAAKENELISPLSSTIAPHSIELQTMYPGMLVGTGISHAFGGKGEAELGLCLDYVTGMPYIPGSSVKGTLRSAFAHEDYIRELLNDAGVECVDHINIGELEAYIFGNSINKKKPQYKVNTYEQDIFYDAIIVSSGKILATDAITPHRWNPELLELAAPNPITMIRIRPNVRFRFQFSLKETLGITSEQKLKIFTYILKDIGIGAKTNVGYGALEDPTNISVWKSASQPQIAGICQKCGKPTKINAKTGEYYPICGACKFVKQ